MRAKNKHASFRSGSKGLDDLVARIQRLPKNSVVIPMQRSGDPAVSKTLNKALKLIERIDMISDDSPAGEHKAEALEIAWGVYASLQGLDSKYEIESRPANVRTIGKGD